MFAHGNAVSALGIVDGLIFLSLFIHSWAGASTSQRFS
jgi:hypothetical protein